MRPESRKRLLDMLEAARAIRADVAAMTVEQFGGDRVIRDAVYYRFMVIGEALSVIRRTDEPTFVRISDSHKIVALRNQIVHGYDVLRHTITWDIIHLHLPVLIAELEALIER